MKYNNETLEYYCKENNIILIGNYENKICREDFIEGKCINKCQNNFRKTFRQMVKTGAYCKDCIKTIASNKIKNALVKWDINELQNFCNCNNIVLLKDYSNDFINRDSIIEGLCKGENCNGIFKKTFREILKLNGFCADCSKEIGKVKIIETNMKKYGVKYSMQNEEIKEKQKQSIIYKYGVDHISKLERIKETKKNKSLQKYGVEYVLQSKQVRESAIQTNLKKYGVKNPQQNEEIKNKIYNTNLKKYGCKYYLQTNEFKDKVIQTNLKKYGVPHHSQNPEIAEKMLKKSYNIKEYIFPSGKKINYQGYENFGFDRLLNYENILENDIITDRNEVPEIWYIDKNNKKRRHFVDIYIKSQNRCIEVKSTFTNQEKNNVFEKQKAAKDLGLQYEIWILNRSGKLLEKYI